MMKVIDCVAYAHDLRLVALSAVICVLGCYTTGTLLARARSPKGVGYRWLAYAAGVFGSSVWSLHFVAMLAFVPASGTTFDLPMTAISLLVASAGGLTAFAVLWGRNPARVRIPLGALLLGLAVTGMHYLGVAAMTSAVLMTFDPAYVAASVAASVGFSLIACLRAGTLATARRRLEVAAWMSLAICGLHFTGMAAITVVPGVAPEDAGSLLGTASLAVAVGAVSVAILIASLVATTIDQRMSERANQDLERMRLLSNLAQEVLIIQRDGIVLEVNSAGERLRKAEARDIVGSPLHSLFSKDSVAALRRRESCPADERRAEELGFQAVDGTSVRVELSCQPIDYMGRPATVIALRDLTNHRREEARIRHMARHDPLTGLPNRYNLLERLETSISQAAACEEGLALIYVDLDRFKPVNDLHGHAAGDAVLIQAGKRIKAVIREEDMLARIGGDEFVLVSPGDADPARVAVVARRVVDALRKPFRVEGIRIEVGASAGVALYPDDGRDVDTLMRAADAAMYRVKQTGRGDVRFYEPSMNDKAHTRLQLEQEMMGAIEAEEFVLHYQPVVRTESGETEAYEALIRWQHPTRGLLQPNDFVPMAEQTGHIDRIGAWVIEAACREAARWPNRRRVCVNVSPAQFRHGDVCDVVRAALRRCGLEPSRLVIEVTEGVLIDDADTAVETLNELKAMGVKIALDDFGTGYSSLSYLQLFRFDRLKIDKSFITKLGRNDDSLTLTRSIINLGHNLGMQVTAEGVETEEQQQILAQLGCDHIQGYLVAKPAPMAYFETARAEPAAAARGIERNAA